MSNERKPAFKQVAPGVLVSPDIKVTIDHPTDCFILRSADDTATFAYRGVLNVFSSEDNARAFIKKAGLTGAIIKPYQWDELVEQFGERFGEILIDHRGKKGFYGTAPLVKGI